MHAVGGILLPPAMSRRRLAFGLELLCLRKKPLPRSLFLLQLFGTRAGATSSLNVDQVLHIRAVELLDLALYGGPVLAFVNESLAIRIASGVAR